MTGPFTKRVSVHATGQLELITAAYRFAGVPDPERLAAAFAAAVTPPALAVPSCPSCAAPPGEVAWIGGAPPHGGDHWRCTRCGHDWTTPPARSKPRRTRGQ